MRKLLVNIFFFFFFFPLVFGQLTESVMKSHFVINMIKFIELENEDTIEQYSIGVLGRTEITEEFKNQARNTRIKNKSFSVIQFKRINDIGGVHILYVDKQNGSAVRKILGKALEEQILVISDSCLNREFTMINLIDLNMPGNQFEINKDNLDKANIHVSPKLLYYGGSQEDLREMYQASEQELSNVQGDLEQKTTQLENLRKDLNLKKQEILALSNEIAGQKQLLKSMTSEVEAKQDSLDLKVALLKEQKMKIREHEADIEHQNAQLSTLENEIEAGSAFLKTQKLEIAQQEEKIAKQQNEIKKQMKTLEIQTGEIQEQTVTIEKQQTVLYYFIAFFVLLAASIFFVLRAYRIKRQANKKLQEKNVAINKQKEEIQHQQEQLKAINQKIEKQNENIKSSIHYALTIQQALLPSKEELDNFFESYMIYRPRDIVSGDFYWVNETIPENGFTKKIFVAVADCTGHGVPGAFLSMIGIKLLNSIVNERKQHDPKVILEMLNSAIQKALKQDEKANDDGMDICLCRLEKVHENKFKVIYSGARRPLYYSSDHNLHVLPGDRKTVGGRFYKEQAFTNQELWLKPGERIYLTSDGIADQNAPSRQKFGSKKLIKILEESLRLPMKEQKTVVEKAIDAFQQNEKQRDDISLMAIKL
jgi:serine phosphatase RsbU (regulator of sigma subunit)